LDDNNTIQVQPHLSAWEKFRLQRHEDGVTLRSFHATYLSANEDGSISQKPEVQRFVLLDSGRSDGTCFLKSVYGTFLCVDSMKKVSFGHVASDVSALGDSALFKMILCDENEIDGGWQRLKPHSSDEAARVEEKGGVVDNVDPFNLQRFLDAQDSDSIYEDVVRELRSGRKRSHWMWFIFPQRKGKNSSHRSIFFAITCKEEAEAYLKHPVLGSRLVECTKLVLALKHISLVEIFNGKVSPDAEKFAASMALFSSIPGVNQDLFIKAAALR
jgi:uncharacterized protein (DUF1810 family)